MADRVHVEVRGVPELLQGMSSLGRDIERSAPQAMRRGAEQAANIARARVPHRSGRLAGSIAAAFHGDHASLDMGSGVPYAGWIEYGGSRGRAYIPMGRYLYPSAKQTEDATRLAAERATNQQVRSHHWPKA